MNGHRDDLPAWARDRLSDEEAMGELKTSATVGDAAGGALVLAVTAVYWLLFIGFIGSCVWGLVWLVSS